ncbi:hypothetical protein SPONN_363 [uncultured Candidatus Thioglobus sp.]|nr:hypothetical protein SPONN_363 [uncultured Candidatus Thioglobus sp.]
MNTCNCTDKENNAKNLYNEKWEAQEQIDYALEERDVKLKMYQCPENNGWHLTSKLDSY